MIICQTKRLILRQFNATEIDLLTELDSDPIVTQYINGGKATPREHIEHDVMPHIISEYDRTPGYGRWAMVKRFDGEFLGWLALRVKGPNSDEAELGYRLRQAAWGQGYATEGARAMVARAFEDLRIQRVWATTMTVNLRSRRVLEKSGLRFVRTFFEEWPDMIEGGEHGDVEYALTREEWQAQR